jgi:CheY-like chemotaxis protein/signal transduction histidine kinase
MMQRTGFEQWKSREVARLLSLVETERRYYQEMVAGLPVSIAVLAGDRTIVSSNRAFRKTVGLKSEELQGRTIEDLLPSNELVEKIRAAHTAGDREPFFLEIPAAVSKEAVLYRVAVAPATSWGEDAEPETVVMLENMTEIDKSRAASFAAAPAGLPAVVWRADAGTLQFQSVTGAAEEISGHAPTHWTSTPDFFWTRIHREDRSHVKALYESAIDKGSEATAEFRLSSHEDVWIRETIRAGQPGAGGVAASVVGVATNVSRRKQLESQLLTAGRVDAIRGLAARLAHDLNNPLMIINGYSEDLMGSISKQDPRSADVAEIISASRRLTDLTGQLLGFARRATHAPSKINLSKAVGDLEIALHHNVAKAPVTTDAGHSCIAFAEPEHIMEVLSSIAQSALALTQSPSSLHVSCQLETLTELLAPSTLGPGTYARINFRATGIGLVNQESLATNLESILPAKDPRSAHAPELARAYALVREWGGDIAISGDNEGALLVLYLLSAPVQSAVPSSPVSLPEAPVPFEAEPAPAAEPEPTKGTILLVDDEPGIRGLVRRILRRENYNVIEAASGEEALSVALSHPSPIHLLLTDVMMPGMTGPQVAASIQGNFPEAKVIYISGYSDPEEQQQIEGELYLQKPFTLSDLLRVVNEALGK